MKYGCTSCSSLDELLELPGLDAVCICTPYGMHLEVTLDRCDRIIEACASKRVPLAGIFQSRFSPLSQLTRKTIDKGGWRGTWRLDGGGALMNQSIHAIDLLQWYMGPVEAVSSFVSTPGHERIEVEDTATAALLA
jgi:UDP-N-acetyl-2-amino-2-deoxyglucuronate dehydrogenase